MKKDISLRVATTVKAPRSKVFEAWTKPEILAKWFAPGPRTPVPEVLDVKPGGKFRIMMQGDEDAPVAVGEYRDVQRNEKLVFTWGWDGDPSQPTLVTVTFADVTGGTEVVLRHERFAAADTRDHHRQGWEAILQKLVGQFSN